MTKKSVFGVYEHRSDVETAVTKLREAGFRASDISVLLPDGAGFEDLSVRKASKAPEGAAAGGGAGAAVGGVLGWLAGIGSLAIPGVGPLIAAGPIVGALAGIGAGGATGAVVGTLVGFGIPEYEAKRYQERIDRGHILLSVHADDADWQERARRIIEDTGADDVHTVSESTDHVETGRPVYHRV